MKHNVKLKIAVAALGLFVATESVAGGKPPWVVPEKGITEAQSFTGARLKKALAINHRKQPFYESAHNIKWSTTMRNYGISNIDAVYIDKLFSGHYFVGVYSLPGNKKYHSTEKVSVRYYGKDGKYFECTAQNNSKRGEVWNGFWSANKNTMGFGGLTHGKNLNFIKKAESSLPVLYDGYRGRTVLYYSPRDKRSHPTKFVGHIQKEYAPVFKAVCPNIPSNGIVNEKQLSPIYAEFVKDARKILNVSTRFKQDIDDPLTAGMYFSLYGPDE